MTAQLDASNGAARSSVLR